MDYVNVYVDNSNIYHEGQRIADQYAGESRQDFRLYFKNFVQLALQGRPAREFVWGVEASLLLRIRYGHISEISWGSNRS